MHEYTNAFEFLSQLTRLEHSTVLSTPISQQMMTPFKYTTGRFPYHKYQSEMQWRQLIEECGFYPVSMKSDVELSSMFLYRRPLNWIQQQQQQLINMPLSVVEEKILIDELEKVELIKRVRVALLEKQLERVWLLSEREPTVELVALVNMLRREIGGEKIRCLFVADRNPINIFGSRYMVPALNELVQTPFVPVSPVQPTTTQWSELFHAIRRADLVMNVFRQGQWGSFRPLVNVRGLYPLTTPAVFPFVHGSALPFPVSAWNTTGTTRVTPLTATLTHLPVGYPFEYYPQQQQYYSQYYPQQQQQFVTPFVVEPIMTPITGTTFSPMNVVSTPVVLPTVGGQYGVESGFPVVEPVTVYSPTTVKSVIYRRQQQLTTTTTTTTVPTTTFATTSPVLPRERVLLNPLQTYIITCGLGSFGLELVEWAIEHGARRVILTTKYGVRTGYQARKLRILRDEYQAQIQVLQVDVREEVECMNLIKEAVAMSVENKIGGIFHLASCVEDALFEQQYPTTQMHEILRRITEFRCQGAYNLDRLTRQTEGIMDETAYFVVFSPFLSTVSGVTSPSVLEKICESRRRVGRHGLAVHWGCTVDSGLWLEKVFAYDNIVEPTYVVPNRIFSILRIMENILVSSLSLSLSLSLYISLIILSLTD